MAAPSTAIDRRVVGTIVGAVLLGSPGCLALNLPSDRHADPSDTGGWFGGWRMSSAGGSPPTAACLTGGALEADPFDPASVPGGVEPESVPWPRFHPVPTRPIIPQP